CATNALGDLVVATVDDEEYAFFSAQNTRATTIEMAEKPEAEDDGVLRRDYLRALRARRGLLFRPCSTPMQRETDGPAARGTTPARVTQGAPRVGEREDSIKTVASRSPRRCAHGQAHPDRGPAHLPEGGRDDRPVGVCGPRPGRPLWQQAH